MGHQEDITIVGAGVIGLALALELHHRGHHVQLWEHRAPGSQASWAAAGMLAATDPHNPAALADFAAFSLSRYPAFLRNLHAATGLPVPFQTDTTVQSAPDDTTRLLAEHSIDPRQLVQALLAAIRLAGIPLHHARAEATPDAPLVVHTTGAWAVDYGIRPCKGQMLRVRLPSSDQLTEVYRSEHVYVVPRTSGPQAGTALLGATVEDCGFDTAVHEDDLARLRQAAAKLVPNLPALAHPEACPVVEAWAGLRPCTPDGLPLLGELASARPGQRNLLATGHFRNGILLAPGTASVVADLIEKRVPPVNLHPFDPARPAIAESAVLAPFGHARR